MQFSRKELQKIGFDNTFDRNKLLDIYLNQTIPKVPKGAASFRQAYAHGIVSMLDYITLYAQENDLENMLANFKKP
jgi:hypothetical protein